MPQALGHIETGLRGSPEGQALSPNGQVLLAELGGDEFFMPKLIGLLQAAAVAASHAANGANGAMAALKALPNWVSPRFIGAFNRLLNNPSFNWKEFIQAANKFINADPNTKLLIANGANQYGQAANQTIAKWLEVSPKAAGWLTTLIRAVSKNTAF